MELAEIRRLSSDPERGVLEALRAHNRKRSADANVTVAPRYHARVQLESGRLLQDVFGACGVSHG